MEGQCTTQCVASHHYGVGMAAALRIFLRLNSVSPATLSCLACRTQKSPSAKEMSWRKRRAVKPLQTPVMAHAAAHRGPSVAA